MLNISSNIIYLFNELELIDRIKASADVGFKAVECQNPYDIPTNRMKTCLADHGVEMVLINGKAGDAEKGDKGVGIFPDRIDEFQTLTGESIDYAAAIGCPRVHVMTGLPGDTVSWEVAESTLIENIRWAANFGQARGVKIMLEPLNATDNPGYFLTNADQAVPLIAAINHDNVYLQYDLYHGGMNGEDITASIAKHFDLIDHMQVAGVPGRNEPTTGDIDFAPIFAAIDDMGYTGWIGAEYAPETNTRDGLAWAAAYGISATD